MVLEESMKRKNKAFTIFVFALTFLISGCSLSSTASKSVAGKAADQKSKAAVSEDEHLNEDRRIYSQDKADSVIDLYVTVDGNQNEPNAFYNLNHWYDFNPVNTESPKLNVTFQVGNDKGPQLGDFGYEATLPNAIMKVRGNTTKVAAQESYEINLNQNAGIWRGSTNIALKKHPFDFSRVRDKLSFDYFTLIPNMTSLRTQFVHLHVKDLTNPTLDQAYEDYGLFTDTELPSKRFLAAHGLDPNGELYKADEFEFYRYPQQLKLATDKTYNQEQFESILEIKGSNDHSKLLKMLDAVNDQKLNINTVIDKYFDRDNYLTWLAANILMGNIDTNSQNFYLYSPTNSQKFYFLPWDYDGAWGVDNKSLTASWHKGISNYWGAVLHRRFFKDPNNVKQLSNKIEELSKIITKDQTKKFLDSYYPIVSSFVKTNPDLKFLTKPVGEYETEYNSLINMPEENKKAYYASLQNPMPFFLGDPTVKGSGYQFNWDPSYDLQGDTLTYDFQISQSIDFSQIYYEKKDMTDVSLNVDNSQLRKGQNYWRVIVTDSKGHSQIAFDSIEDNHIYYNGVKGIFIK
jgi:spore coat protein H